MTVRVVIAEDEAIIRLDLKETLEEEGYVVVGETGRGDKAVELVREHRPDLAILDIKMPGMDGLEAARHITKDRICGVLVLTAFSQREIIEEARDAGALAYLVKPFQKSDLIPAIEVALGRFRELQALNGEVEVLGEQLEARKAIDRAKGVLIDTHGMSESDAYGFIQRGAMNHRTTMRAVAEMVISGGPPCWSWRWTGTPSPTGRSSRSPRTCRTRAGRRRTRCTGSPRCSSTW
jgi:response regulator NasT